MKDKFIVKTIKRENVEVEGKLIMPNDKPLPPRKPSNIKIKQPTLRELFVEFRSDINTRLDKVDSRLDNINTRLDNIDTRLDNVIKLNNLKE